ncbi:hypothetical protein [Ancylobacter amanitiformis]|uniref:Uncharacterized protein n=1 Tax=Ancylobacter amanitiformis TaxID=217069 RepID=A0ABU0LTL3_9HYPH|nr:hypothetical protein [Ancylobacter amanitiformis]MDQ0512044.1 hypothetical protein [Ancylobacter amanitiformis]
MSNVIPFPARPEPSDTEADAYGDLDIFTAVDVAIRDLRDLAERLHADDAGKAQAQECLTMLCRALENSSAWG